MTGRGRKVLREGQETRLAEALTVTSDMRAAAKAAEMSERTAWRVLLRIKANQAAQRWIEENRAYVEDINSGWIGSYYVTLTPERPPRATGLIRLNDPVKCHILWQWQT